MSRDGAVGPAGRKQGRESRALEGRRKRKGGTDTRDHAAREKGGRKGAAQLGKEVAPTCGPVWQRVREGEKRGDAGPAEGGRGKRPTGKKEGIWAVGLLLSSSSSFLFLSYTQAIQTIPCEFK
jgi:hypothetical protein